MDSHESGRGESRDSLRYTRKFGAQRLREPISGILSQRGHGEISTYA